MDHPGHLPPLPLPTWTSILCTNRERLVPLHAQIADWFTAKGWAPRRHQLEVLRATSAGHSALLIAPTGAGKTLAGFLPTLDNLVRAPMGGLHTLYISPLKALAVDVQRNLMTPITEMGLPFRVEARTGDPPASRRQRQRDDPPSSATPMQPPSLARCSASCSTNCTRW